VSPQLSVIIPTHNRADILAKCLAHLAKQTIAENIEVIVVSDTNNPATTELCTQPSALNPLPPHFRFIEIPPCQQGTARNRGVAIATAPACFFIGDDIFLKEDCCALHESIHRNMQKPVAVLGSIGWDPDVGITPVMEWLAMSGWQFGYPSIERYAGDFLPKSIQHQFSYASNISVPTEIARRIPFLEDISLYGWEDIEWGARLRDAGIPLFFAPDARALHHHTMTLEESLRRMETLGASVVKMESITPGFDRRPRGWKLLAYKVFAGFPTMSGKHRAAFLRGMNKAMSDEE